MKKMNKRRPKNAPNSSDNSSEELRVVVDQLLKVTSSSAPADQKEAWEVYKSVHLLLNKVRLLEKVAERPEKRDDELTTKCFLKWLAENGASFRGLSLREFEGYGLGLCAEEAITKDALIITVPQKLIMTSEMAKRSALRSLLKNDQLLKSMPNVALAVYLLLEKANKNSFWKPYIDMLPAKYTTVLYMTTSDLMELNGSPTLESALKQIKSIARQYCYFKGLFWILNDALATTLRSCFTYEEYCWAVSTVMTRQNCVPSKDNKQMYALIPLWDMANHSNGSITTHYNMDLQRIECTAMRDYAQGEQVFIHYGDRSNGEFFLHNGFVYESNPNDTYCLRVGISKMDQHFEGRHRLVNWLGMTSPQEFHLRHGDKPLDGRLCAFARILVMEPGDLAAWGRRSGKALEEEMLDMSRCPQAAWKFLMVRLNLLLMANGDAQPATVDDPSRTACSQLVARIRNCERWILREALDFVQARMN